MQTRPMFIVSFQTRVESTVETFDVPAYSQRMRTALGTEEVGVTVAPGSVVGTTTAGSDSQVGADELVSEITNMAGDPELLSELYGAQAAIDLDSIAVAQNPDAVMPPPAAPPPLRSEENHVILSVIIICVVLVPVVIFLAYLWVDKAKPAAKAPRSPKPYARVTTKDDLVTKPSAEIRFKLEL